MPELAPLFQFEYSFQSVQIAALLPDVSTATAASLNMVSKFVAKTELQCETSEVDRYERD